ncbi:helix-turn-helix domain-containing protein [Streptomyces botrytidirepellens]|uniref:Helix-turn-helix domain-containing protein n=1 Tax=Streptomyces botrytidirepellens TaxID=2486417 RepID=A0A3M8WWU9_9ACTN|nr:helix-turn-helix domain-containing protein [Streptomyces botrytidirepellens]RNG34668.1 helix-turn-helix domain-containing protein [Streptomyces botrytidirepellens]
MWLNVSNEELPAEEQLPFWGELVSRELAPLTLSSANGVAGFPAWASVLGLGSVRVAAFNSPPAYLRRTWADIRRADPGTYQLAFVSGTPLWISQRRQDSGLVLGDMVLFDLSHPFEGEVPDAGRHTQVVIVQLPREELPLAPNKVHRLVAQPLSTRTGMGAILARFMTTLDAYGPDCDPRDLNRLGAMTLDLAGACLAQHLGAYDDLPAETRQQALLARVNAFIDHNLGDPDLRPADVAAHHHISVRSLHTLFRHQGETVAASIRRRRLERCHADLTDLGLRWRSISAIAARWGFLRPADFSRAFRAAYGVAPRELRQAALHSLTASQQAAPRDK